MNDTKWEAPNSYNAKNFYSGEIGRICGVRFVESSEAKIFEKAGANSIDVYSTLFLGADAYGTTAIEGGGLEMIIKPKGSSATKAACILTDAYMVRVETASKYN